jgi:hypothetical protein
MGTVFCHELGYELGQIPSLLWARILHLQAGVRPSVQSVTENFVEEECETRLWLGDHL